MSPPRIIAATLAWLAVVASVSALVWVVISRAGGDLVSSDQALTTRGEPRATTPARATDGPSRTPSPSPSGGRSGTASPSPTSSPAVPSPSTSPTSSSISPASPATPTEQPSGAASEQRRTWEGQAGSIVAACGATGIRFVSAQPADGFHAEVKDDDGALVVEFEGREDREGTHVKVAARCVEGVPSFAVESDD